MNNEFAHIQYIDENGTVEICLQTCLIGGYYFPGNEPLQLVFHGRDEAWGLLSPLFSLKAKEHHGLAFLLHKDTTYRLTDLLWRSLCSRLCDFIECIDLGMPHPAMSISTGRHSFPLPQK
jgi:hypothetical protein